MGRWYDHRPERSQPTEYRDIELFTSTPESKIHGLGRCLRNRSETRTHRQTNYHLYDWTK